TTALEAMVDEICTALPLDPIEFRRRNALATGGRTLAGNTYSVSIRTPEILDRLERHPIWKERAEGKARGEPAGNIRGDRGGESRRELSSVPGSRVPPRTTAPAAIVRWDPSKSLPMAALPSIATASRSAPALGQRRPIASPRIWVPSPTKSRWRASTHSARW